MKYEREIQFIHSLNLLLIFRWYNIKIDLKI